MSYLRIPKPYVSNYPLRTYTALDNLRRVTEFNRGQMADWVLRTGYNLNNRHPLVNLLQLLAIDPSWTLDELVTIVRYKMNSVCSLCDITNINRNAPSLTNVFYANTREVLFAVYNDKTYVEENLTLSSLEGVIPVYINDSFTDYTPCIERINNTYQEKGKVAFIGIDVVELAVGWWLYMKHHTGVGTGIHAYLMNYPLRKASLIHNELNIVNALYDYCLEDKPFAESVDSPSVPFFTLDEEAELRKYLVFLHTTFTQKRITHIDQLLTQLFPIYKRKPLSPYDLILTNKGMTKKLDNFNNLRWVLDAATLKIMCLYLHYANAGFYRAGDINTLVSVNVDKMVLRYGQITDKGIAKHLIALTNRVDALNKVNLN